MGRATSSFLYLSLWAFACALSAYADESHWDDRYNEAVRECIVESKKDLQCVHSIDGNPLKVASRASEAFYDTSYEGVYRAMGEAGRTAAAARALLDDNAPFFKRYNSELNYDALKRWAQYRAKKDNLEGCQRACLATCISSRMMEYDDRNLTTHWKEGLEREKGVCREFSGMAADLMRAMGLKAKTTTGVVYQIKDGEAPKREGGHVMVEVNLPSGNYLMEPQSGACEFYDKSFSTGVRQKSSRILNAR